MDIIEMAAKALTPISEQGIIVKQGWYDEKLQNTHITLWNLSDTDEGYCDDDAELTEGIVQINIWAFYDAVDLKKEVKKLLVKAGFLYEDGQDVEEKHGLYNKAMRFYRMQEIEEDE